MCQSHKYVFVLCAGAFLFYCSTFPKALYKPEKVWYNIVCVNFFDLRCDYAKTIFQ